jgi:cobalt-zinc-cadmium efflux system outer membrane protein
MKIFPAIGIFLLPLAAGAEPAATSSTATYIDLLAREAVRHHPKVEAERERNAAALAAVNAVRLWEDPQLGLGATAASREMRRDDGDIRIAVDQMLPRRGLYQAETRRATAEQQAQDAMRRLTANELALSVAQTVLELALADDVISLQSEELQWLETIVGTARERAKNPDGAASETLRLEGELALRQQRLAAAQRQRSQFARTLNILLGRASKDTWETLTLPVSAPPAQNLTGLKAQLERNSPVLAGSRFKVDGAQAEADASREKRKPVFSFGVESNIYSGEGDLRDTMFMLKMTLPWINRRVYEADALRAERSRAAAQSDLAAQQRELFTRLTVLMTEAENNRQNADAYKGEVLPKTQKALDIIQGAWISSKATLLEVLDARRALLEVRQEQKRALAAHHVALRSIQALTGNLARNTEGK